MRHLLIASLLVVSGWVGGSFGTATPREIDNAAAFARVFGVVRYFYPTDAAADIDWNRFAVHGVKLSRIAPDAKSSLETTLKQLFAPLGPGIYISTTLPPPRPTGPPDPALGAWRYLGSGFPSAGRGGPYAGKRTHRALSSSPGIYASNELIPDAVPMTGASVDMDLSFELKARVVLALPEGQATADAKQATALDTLRTALRGIGQPGDQPDADVRLADVVVAWNVFRHFYPYWNESGVDWNARLRPQLEDAGDASERRRVTSHDGLPFHLIGVKPDIPLRPTIAGLRAGRDEVLDEAVARIQGK